MLTVIPAGHEALAMPTGLKGQTLKANANLNIAWSFSIMFRKDALDVIVQIQLSMSVLYVV